MKLLLKLLFRNLLIRGILFAVTDGKHYSFLENTHSGFNHITHVHASGNFGLGISSTSHIESIWAQIKGNIKRTYNVIPNKIFSSGNII